MKLLLRHERGVGGATSILGPKTIDEWATPNGDEPLLIWMLREIEKGGATRVELVAVDEQPLGPEVEAGLYVEELRPE